MAMNQAWLWIHLSLSRGDTFWIWIIQIILFLLSVYSALVALLFSAFLIYDTQQIMGGKKYEISPEEHVYASIQLYVDVVYIFLAILSLGRR